MHKLWKAGPAENLMRDVFRNFDRLISHTLLLSLAGPRLSPRAVPGTVSLETGIVFPQALTNASSISLRSLPPPVEVVDGAGHRRPIYRGLLVYAWLRTMEIAVTQWHEQLLPWCDAMEENRSDQHRAEMAWEAMALSVAAKAFRRPEWSTFSQNALLRIVNRQQKSGAFFPVDTSINPETRWYDELVLLHAMGTYAAQTQDRTIHQAVRRAAEFHTAETQPDHATQQPWAIFAFLCNSNTQIQAEEILHAAVMRDPQHLDAISLVLLADALWCLRRAQVEGSMFSTSS